MQGAFLWLLVKKEIYDDLSFLKDKSVGKIAVANIKPPLMVIAAYEAFGKAGVLEDIERS